MSTPESTADRDYERHLLGAIALIMLGGGAIGLATESDPGWPGIVLRSGIILGAIWIGLPSLRRMRRRTMAAFAIPVVVLMVRPRLILIGVVVGLVVWLVTRQWRSAR